MGELVDLTSRAGYVPDTVALACGKLAATREQLGLSREEFADKLSGLLSWVVSPGTVGAWERGIAAPPGDVLAACDLLTSSAGTANGTGDLPIYPERLNSDEQERIRRTIHSRIRLDATTIVDLTHALAGQRHAEDGLGPALIIDSMSKQRDVLEALVRNYNGPHTKGLTRLVANWTTYVGWLHTACREYSDADSLFAKAESMADEIDDGILASTATSYRGYLSLLQGHHRAALRSTMAALGTPGAHSTQIAYDMLQAAQAYAGLGDNKEASRLLHEASDIVSNAGAPPESIYWYTEPFLRMNIGLAQHSIGRYRDAVDSISSGLAELPVGQRQAEWLDEYQQALEYSSVNADQQD